MEVWTEDVLYMECLHMEMLQGTLDMLVLRTLLFGPLHGYGIAKVIRTTSDEALDIEFGSLYPALKRLELKGWISSRWEKSERNRRAKFYRLTPAGRRQLVRGALEMGPVRGGGRSCDGGKGNRVRGRLMDRPCEA